MNAMDAEFIEKCDLVFSRLHRVYLDKMVYLLGWPMDDLKQEFRLTCWEIASGITKFDSAKGDILGYFNGRLRVILSNRENVVLCFGFSVENISDDGNSMIDAGLVSSQSRLDLMIERENRKDAERNEDYDEAWFNDLQAAVESSNNYRKDWIGKFSRRLSQIQIAHIGGFSQSTVSRLLKKTPEARKKFVTCAIRSDGIVVKRKAIAA